MPERNVILLAEDNEDHVLLIRRAFRQARVMNPFHVVHNGEEVLNYLKGAGVYANRAEYPLPDLLLLDLKMPRKNGFEVLEWIRSQDSLRAMRVVVLTTSSELQDVNRAYQLGANSFLVKPGDFQQIVSLVQTLNTYWIRLDQAPEVTRPDPESLGPNGPSDSPSITSDE